MFYYYFSPEPDQTADSNNFFFLSDHPNPITPPSSSSSLSPSSSTSTMSRSGRDSKKRKAASQDVEDQEVADVSTSRSPAAAEEIDGEEVTLFTAQFAAFVNTSRKKFRAVEKNLTTENEFLRLKLQERDGALREREETLARVVEEQKRERELTDELKKSRFETEKLKNQLQLQAGEASKKIASIQRACAYLKSQLDSCKVTLKHAEEAVEKGKVDKKLVEGRVEELERELREATGEVELEVEIGAGELFPEVEEEAGASMPDV